jgi:large subunit ribosomal protein L13
MKLYNADGQIMGRLSSIVAKKLIEGEEVIVVNVEKTVLSGKKAMLRNRYLEKTKRGDPWKGPFFPRTPDRIFRRSVRGMLPWDRPRGKQIYRKLKVFIGVPAEYSKGNFEKTGAADASKLKAKNMTLGDLAVSIGARKRW